MNAAAVSTGQRNTGIETLSGCFVVEHLSRSFVELSGDSAQLCLTMYRQIRSFWEVLSQQSVRCRQTNSNSSLQRHWRFPLSSAETTPFGESGDAVARLRILPNHACAIAAQHTHYTVIPAKPDSDLID